MASASLGVLFLGVLRPSVLFLRILSLCILSLCTVSPCTLSPCMPSQEALRPVPVPGPLRLAKTLPERIGSGARHQRGSESGRANRGGGGEDPARKVRPRSVYGQVYIICRSLSSFSRRRVSGLHPSGHLARNQRGNLARTLDRRLGRTVDRGLVRTLDGRLVRSGGCRLTDSSRSSRRGRGRRGPWPIPAGRSATRSP